MKHRIVTLALVSCCSIAILHSQAEWTGTIITEETPGDVRRPMAAGVYDLYTNKTVISFLGTDWNPYIAICDHSNGNQWSEIIKIGDPETLELSKYSYPNLVQTFDGVYHAFFVKHTTNMWHSWSTNPHDPASWQEEEMTITSDHFDKFRPSYPKPFVARNGVLYVFWRNSITDVIRPKFYAKSTDNGKTWSKAIPAIYPLRPDNMNEIYCGHIVKEPDIPGEPERFHFAFILAGGAGHNDYHKNIYHCYMTPENDHFYGMDGIDLGTTIDEVELDAHCLVLDTGPLVGNTNPGYYNTVGIGDNMIPFINRQYVWNGSSWTNLNPVGLSVSEAPDYYQWFNGKIYAIGGTVYVFESSDYGHTWTRTGNLVLPKRNSGGSMQAIPVTYTFHPSAWILAKEVRVEETNCIVTCGGPNPTGIPNMILLHSKPTYLKLGDTCAISAFICDSWGARVMTATNYVRFSISGGGDLIGDEFVAANAGKATILFKAGSSAGKTVVSATSDGLKANYIEIIYDENGQAPYPIVDTLDNNPNPDPDDMNLIISGVPNVFTPNGDGINELWIVPSLDNFPFASVCIYDENMKLVIEYSGSDPGWDGKDAAGNPMKSGSYLYIIRFEDKKIKPLTGHISLVR